MLLRHYWERWQRELLPLLHNRQKWLFEKRNLRIGDTVILADEKTSRGQWCLGRIIQTYPGEDGIIRVARVKTVNSELTRPVHKLCPLEFNDPIKKSDSETDQTITDEVTDDNTED